VLPDAERDFRRHPTWGELHQIGVSHALARVPLLGGRLPRAQRPVPGSSNTLWKSAAAPQGSRHRASYGANARHVSDLSDPDANWFVLFGGQDGDPFAQNFSDQVERFLTGEYLHVPLRVETVEATFPHRMDFGR
jgi:penicillin amidase